MSKKTLKSYVAVFNELLTIAGNHELNLCPQRIICDFEMGIISAIKQCFPNTDLRGCLFHFGQLIWRKVQKERLAQKYGTSVEFALQVRMIKSLAFVPPSEIPNYFQTLLNNCDDESVKNLVVWFDKNYIDINNNNSKYSPEFWSVHDHNASQTETFPRTQNNIEAWHRRLKVIVGRRNSQFYHLVLSLQKELILAKTQISRKENGERVRKKGK